MTPHSQSSENDPSVSEGSIGEDDISLRPLFQALWRYRWVMVLLGCVVVAVFVLWGLSTYMGQPVERQASVEFRLLFDGATENTYPNGLPFSRSEIVGDSILPEVYRANDLERYFSFDAFKRKLVVLGTNSEVELLNLEYQARLSGDEVSQVDRVDLEDEFGDLRRALQSAHYRLSYITPGTVVPLPDELLRKVLSDILTEWAEQAAGRKGVLSYLVRPLNPSMLNQELLVASEHFVKADVLRGQIGHVLANLDMLEPLPGASNFRSQADGVTLAEIRLNLEGLVRYRLEPLTANLWTNLMFVDTDTLANYVQNRLFQIELELDEALGLRRTLQDSLQNYLADNVGARVSPLGADGTGGAMGLNIQGQRTFQIGDAFLERIIALAGESVDLEFRQGLTNRIIQAGEATIALQRESAYYEEAIRRVRQAQGLDIAEGPAPELLRVTGVELDEVSAVLIEMTEQTNSLYDELSSQNLNPQTALFEITSPYAVTYLQPVTPRSLGVYALFTLLAALIVVPLSCLLHAYIQRQLQLN